MIFVWLQRRLANKGGADGKLKMFGRLVQVDYVLAESELDSLKAGGWIRLYPKKSRGLTRTDVGR